MLDVDSSKSEYWAARPKPLSHLDFAYTLTVPDSEDDHGNLEPYDPRSHGGQFWTLKALDGQLDPPGHHYKTFVLISDTQGGGKSWLLQQCAFHDMVEKGQNVIYALPTRDLGGDIWSLKLRPAISGAGLERFLPETGTGSKDGSKPRFVPFRRVDNKGGGTLVFMAAGGRGQSGQAALTARKLLVDEVDDWEEPALHRIRRRIDRNNETAIQFYACTIKKDDNPYREDDHSLIVDLYRNSTQGRIEYECPHCKAWTRFEWETFRVSEDGRTTIACLACATTLSESERTNALSTSRYVADNPTARDWGLRLSALDCPWKSLKWLGELWTDALKAQNLGNHEPMRQFYHDQRAQQYDGDTKTEDHTEQISTAYLMQRSALSDWGPSVHVTDRTEREKPSFSRHVAPLPTKAEATAAAIDISANRCYWSLIIGNADASTYDVAWGYEHFDRLQLELNKEQLWAVLDRIDGVISGIVGEKGLTIAGVDSNYRTDDVHHWLNLHTKWWPLYGASAQKAAKMSGKQGQSIGDYPGILYFRRASGWKLRQPAVHIDTNPMRLAAQRAFLIPANQPQAAHLPHGLTSTASDRTYLEHLCGEMWDDVKLKWETPAGAGRHDWLDCRTYCQAMLRYHFLKLSRPRPQRKFGVVGQVK